MLIPTKAGCRQERGARSECSSFRLSSKTCRRSPGSRACCFSACAGSKTTQDRAIHSRLSWLLCCLPPLGTESAPCSVGFSKLNSPAHRYLCLRLRRYLATSPPRLEARMDSLLSFPVRLFHPLQHAGLSRRSPDCRRSVPNIGRRRLRPDEPVCRQFRFRYFPKSISGRHHRAMAPIRVIRPSRFQPFPPRCRMPRPYDNAMRAIRRKKGPVR